MIILKLKKNNAINLFKNKLDGKILHPIVNSVKISLLLMALCIASCDRQDIVEEADMQMNPDKSFLKVASGLSEIKVMSFNIRMYIAGNTDPFTVLERRAYILQTIVDNDPDICGIQEWYTVDSNIAPWLETQMAAEGYGAVHGTGENGQPKVIFYKTNRFTRIDNENRTIQMRIEAGFAENRFGRWTILEDDITDQSFFVVNSHWSTDGSADRVKNAACVLDTIAAFHQNLPVIAMGDFNAVPGTTEITNFKTGGDLVCTHNESGNTFHGWDATGDAKIDYIMCSRDLAVIDCKVIQTSYTYNGQTLWPSDHWPIMASIVPNVFGAPHYDVNGLSAVSSTKFYFADVDGDGDEDKIFWRYNYNSGSPRVFLSDGDGTFTHLAYHTASASTSTTTKYYFSDVDGDGMADLIRWDSTLDSGRTRVYLATGGGYFSSTPVINTEGTSVSALTSFYFADVTGDGKADKIYWNPTYDSGHTRVYVATGSGYFSSSVVSNTVGLSTVSATKFYFADVTGDGMADKIFWRYNYEGGKTIIYPATGSGYFSSTRVINDNGWATSTNTCFHFADVTGDGMADKIYWDPDTYLGKVKVFRAIGNGVFDDAIWSFRGPSMSENTQYFFTDVSGDGKADQVCWNYTESPDGYPQGTLKNYIAE
ncbi:FG-GAP-like repeat-containing protein [Draconibacterium orientale]|uniref:FG-GAP-like repeat-containing protein n=1 Tax=Draconibacterium orientale TaxID=1168034 RepID=UPI002ABE5964|nr:FG-GAP-like repeat-containing protein [Draconibacterium orientale]